MAGSGFKIWATADIVTAAAMNGYVQEQVVGVFADSSARSTAISSPSEGMVSWLSDSDSLEAYDGSAWNAIGGGTAGLTFQGSNTVEATTTSTTATDLSTIGSLSIGASTPIVVQFSFRKTSGTNGGSSFGIKLNSTIAVDAGYDQNSIAYMTGSTALSGHCTVTIGPRTTNYLRAMERTYNFDSGGADTARFDIYYSNNLPTATITDVTIRGDSYNADTTIATTDVYVYTLATS